MEPPNPRRAYLKTGRPDHSSAGETRQIHTLITVIPKLTISHTHTHTNTSHLTRGLIASTMFLTFQLLCYRGKTNFPDSLILINKEKHGVCVWASLVQLQISCFKCVQGLFPVTAVEISNLDAVHDSYTHTQSHQDIIFSYDF